MNEQAAPRPQAVALSYADRQGAPRVVAKGYGATAESIVQRAREHGVYVHGSRELVQLLMRVDLDQQIPPALYLAVAELLAWLRAIDGTGAAHRTRKLSNFSGAIDVHQRSPGSPSGQ